MRRQLTQDIRDVALQTRAAEILVLPHLLSADSAEQRRWRAIPPWVAESSFPQAGPRCSARWHCLQPLSL
jgi:hypothetical protein